MQIRTNEDFKSMVAGCGDFLSLVVKSHYSIDQLFNTTLEESLASSESIELRRVSFLLKFDFLAAMGFLRREIRPIFNSINALRNDFAHDPYYEISDERALKISNILKSTKPKLVPDDFGEPFSIRDITETLFAVGFVNLRVAYERLCVRSAEYIVSGQMAAETLAGTFDRKAPSVHEEFKVRVRAYMSKSHPSIEPPA